MSLHDMLEVLLPHRRVGKEGANELGDLLRREIDEVAVVEEEEDVGLRASAVSDGEVEGRRNAPLRLRGARRGTRT